MEYRKLKGLNVFLVMGIAFFIAVTVVSFVKPDYLRNNIFELLLILQIALGAVIITASLLVTKYASHLFIGLTLCGWGILIFLISAVFPNTIFQWWPVFGILAGIFLLISGYFRYKKCKVGYVFPSIVMVVFSLWYSLFSFKFIKMPFSTAVYISGPFFVIAGTVFLVLFYFAQKKNKNLVIKEDGADVFSEEDFNHYREETDI